MSESVGEHHERATRGGSESENPAIRPPEATGHRPQTNKDWWPNQLDLSVLHQHSPASSPMEADFASTSRSANASA